MGLSPCRTIYATDIKPVGTLMPVGILSGTAKRKTLPEIKAQMPEKPMKQEEVRVLTEYKPGVCPYCKTETMVTIEVFFKRGPPMIYLQGVKNE